MRPAGEHIDHAKAVLHEETFAAFLETRAEQPKAPPPENVPARPTPAKHVERLPVPPVWPADADFPEPEDRSKAALSGLGGVEYVDDLVRPGRITLVAAEESTGKSYAITGELAIRVAVAGGDFAETWTVREPGPVLVLSEMHPDDDYQREETVLAALGRTRADLKDRYYRLPLYGAAGGPAVLRVPEWRTWITSWLEDEGAVMMVFDTATGAADVDPWGRDIQTVYRDLRAMLERYPELAIVLIVHLKKPQGRGERRISDVLGEWGRWCDVVLLMESEGADRTRLTIRKRVRRERRIVVTKRDGLLVDARDADSSGPKVPAETVLAAVADKPGMSYAELGAALGVSKDTASNYVKALGGQLVTASTGPKGGHRVYLTAEPPNSAEHVAFGGASAVSTADEADNRRTAEPPYIDRRSASAVGGPAVIRLPLEEEHR